MSDSAFADIGADYLGTVLDGIFYGFHAALFVLFIGVHRYRRSKFYHGILNIATIILFSLCTAVIIVDIWSEYNASTNQGPIDEENLNLAYSALYSAIDFVAQMILLYRCWIIWNKKWYIVVLPALLSTATLASELALVGILKVSNYSDDALAQILRIGRFAFSTSMAVNTIVMALIIVRIWLVSKEIRDAGPITTRDDKTYNIVIAMLMESGVAIFVAQIFWLVLFSIHNPGYYLVGGAVTQIYGITPTILIIRVALGASYDVKTKMSTRMDFAHDYQMRKPVAKRLSLTDDVSIARATMVSNGDRTLASGKGEF